jgi:hypothetical protein
VRLVDLEIVALKTIPKRVNERSIDIKSKKLYTASTHPIVMPPLVHSEKSSSSHTKP